MRLNAEHMSTRSVELLERSPLLRIASLFDHVVNLVNESDEVVSLQAVGTAFTPLTVMLNDDDFKRIRRLHTGEELNLAVTCDWLSDCHLLSGAHKPPQWTKLLQQTLSVMAHDRSLAYSAHPSLWSTVVDPDPIQRVARNTLNQATHLYKTGHLDECCNQLESLSGLGLGLTPAGDDLLLGIMAACWYSPEERTDYIRQHLSCYLTQQQNTTRLSRAFASCAAEGEFALPIHAVFRAENADELVQTVAEEIHWGHTSGSDVMGGILWMTTAA